MLDPYWISVFGLRIRAKEGSKAVSMHIAKHVRRKKTLSFSEYKMYLSPFFTGVDSKHNKKSYKKNTCSYT